MNKAAAASLMLLLAPALLAQTPTPADLQTSIDEVVRREAYTVDLRKKLADAQTAQKKGDHFEAAKLYTDCVGLTKKIGTPIPEQKAVLAGLITVRLQLAEQAQRRADFA